MIEKIRESRLTDILFWLFRWWQRVRVVGVSMQPLLQPGDEILVNVRAYWRSPPLPGDIVILKHPHQKNLDLIKRVVAVNSEGDCLVQGDNLEESNDSRHFGWVKTSLILGRVECRFL